MGKKKAVKLGINLGQYPNEGGGGVPCPSPCHQPSLHFTSFHYSSFSRTFNCQRLVRDSISYPFFNWFIKHQDSDEDGSTHPASLVFTQKTHSQGSSDFQLPDGGNEDQLGLSSDEDDDEEDEEDDEESKDAKFLLVSKESFWQPLSKCQKPRCSLFRVLRDILTQQRSDFSTSFGMI